MAFKMRGYSAGEGTGPTMAKQKVSKDKSQTRNLYQGPITEEDQKRLDAGESKFDIFNEKDEAAWHLEEKAREQIMSQEMGDDKHGKKKAKKTQKKANTLYNEGYIVRDRKPNKK